MRLRRNIFAATTWSESEIVRVLRLAPATSARKIAVSATSRWQLRNCQCQHMATSHLDHSGCNTHHSTVGPVLEAVAAVVHW
jgi:hypothetical protein